MARIAGVNLPNQTRLEIGLTYIYGIGQPTARKVAAALGLSPDTKIRDLTDDEVTKLRQYIDENLQVEGEIVEALPSTMFRVQIDGMDNTVLATISGKMRKHYIRILPGDKVKVELSPYDLTRGRITYRHR